MQAHEHPLYGHPLFDPEVDLAVPLPENLKAGTFGGWVFMALAAVRDQVDVVALGNLFLADALAFKRPADILQDVIDHESTVFKTDQARLVGDLILKGLKWAAGLLPGVPPASPPQTV